jgi:glycosyltransferase involved in cell wall biosynthesis
MHILMIAPQPFFEPRGTPFSEFHRIRALVDLGHTVDLVTYPFGEDVSIPGLRIFRCLRPPFIRRVRVGPSWAKVPLDLSLAATVLRRAVRGRYDAVHSHEEGGLIGVLVAGLLRVPHLYDMHSSLPQQLTNFDFSDSRLLKRLADWGERVMVRRSDVVIVICQQLVDVVHEIEPAAAPILIENAPGSGEAPTSGSGARVRTRFGIPPEAPLVLYTGTFEAYQGLDLLYAAAARVKAADPGIRFLLAGGSAEQVAAARKVVDRLGVADTVVFAGQRAPAEIPAFLDAATVLASPRSTGTNTPLKIYQYLRSGRPIVATRLLTHTQVLDDQVAVLTAPTPEAFAAGLLAVARGGARAAELGRRARQLAETKYSYEAYLGKTRAACSRLAEARGSEVAGDAA